MPKNPHADFSPALFGYSGIGAFRFWCQTALPLTYDDSLSYYELLCKVVNYLNHTIEDLSNVEENTGKLAEAYNKLQNYVNEYFDKLDVEAELRNVLDAMAEDGTLDALLDPLVENHLPEIVDEKIDGVVAEQIDDAVAEQIDESVAGQLPALVDAGIPGEVSGWLKENVDPVGSAVVVDSSLTISGAAADAKVTGDEVSDLKTQFGQNLASIRKAFPTSTNLFNIDDPNVMNGKYITNTGEQGTSQTGVLCESGWIAVEPSAQYTIGANSANYPRFITEYDSSKNVISGGGASEANITTTVNTAYIRFCFRNTDTNWRMNKGSAKLPYEPYYYDYVSTDDTLTEPLLPANAKAVGDMFNRAGYTNETFTADNALEITFTDGYIGTNGGESSSQALHYSQRISVSEGDTLYTDGKSPFRFVCAYNAIGSAVSASGAESVSPYTVPSGIAEVVVTTYKTYTGEIRQTTTESHLVLGNGQFGYFRATGNLNNGDALILPITNINKNIREVFTADITSFSGILIGRKTGTSGYWVKIDSTNITVYHDNTAFGDPVPHGLTIENNIQVRIISHPESDEIPNDRYNVDITVTSNGIDYTLTNVNWVRTYNNPMVQSDGSTLTDCVLSWESGDVGKSIYAFGDSYFSWYPERWVYYCALSGFAKNALFNAYAGENSSNAIVALNNVAPLGKPKYMLWCLGMNDGGDSESEPSAAWIKGRDAAINICKRYGITLIFGTIPTVPTINNEQKNAWIRSSGYRYVDFAKAVGADSSGNWYNGMLDSDGIHPTEQGAKALYGRVLADFPEIMVSN